MKRFLKHLLYGVFYLIILGAVAYGAYAVFFRRPAAPCSVPASPSYGAPCPANLGTAAQPLSLPDGVTVFSPEPGVASVLARVANPNSDLAARDVPYVLTLYDAQGNSLPPVAGDFFVYGGEVKYLALAALPAGSSAPVRGEINFSTSTADWVPADSFARPSLAVQSASTSEASGTLQVSGSILNSDAASFPKVQIVGIFVGQSGIALGVSTTELDGVSPGESRQFVLLHPPLNGADPSRTEVFVYAARP